MKIRESFVANSSSSSFIVIYRDFDIDTLLESGVFPKELQGKIVAFTNKYLSEAEDKVILTQDILEYLQQNYESQRNFNYTPFVEVVDSVCCGDEFIIKPEHVGCKTLTADVDYCATSEVYELFVERYGRY